MKYCENPNCSCLAVYQVTVNHESFNACARCFDAMQMVDVRAHTDMVAIPLCDVEVYCDSCTKFGCKTCGCQHPDASICDEYEERTSL